MTAVCVQQEGVAVQEVQAGQIQQLNDQLSRAQQRLAEETTERERIEDRLDAARPDLQVGQNQQGIHEAASCSARSHATQLTCVHLSHG